MQQEPIINHGNLIDTYNYAALLRSYGSIPSFGYRVANAKKSTKFKPRFKRTATKAKTKTLRKNNTIIK